MKELSIEQKAKRYDEALERAKGAHNSAKSDKENGVTDKITEYTIQLTETIFHELKESEDSEDERIRKHLIGVVELYYGNTDEQEKKDCLDWLEKQDGQKPVDKAEPKFKIGDVIVEIKPNGYRQPVRVKSVDEESYYCKSDDEKRFLSFPIISQDEYELVKQVSVWSEEEKNILDDIIHDYEMANKSFCGYEARINWLKSLKDRVQPKQEWSEEDEMMLGKCLDAASGYYSPEDKQSMKDWLKSLKDRYTWKPSKEQMETLKYACGGNYVNLGILESLYNDLKKLKG